MLHNISPSVSTKAIAEKNDSVSTLRPPEEAKQRVQRVLDAKAWANHADKELAAQQEVAQDMSNRIAKVEDSRNDDALVRLALFLFVLLLTLDFAATR